MVLNCYKLISFFDLDLRRWQIHLGDFRISGYEPFEMSVEADVDGEYLNGCGGALSTEEKFFCGLNNTFYRSI